MQRQSRQVPRVTAEVTFLTPDEGGRGTPPSFTGPGQYVPHIVVQPREVREAVRDDTGAGTELYEGVDFIERPADYRVGTPGIFLFDLMYHPGHRYPSVQPGATFTVREGSRIVAHGVVKARTEPATGPECGAVPAPPPA